MASSIDALAKEQSKSSRAIGSAAQGGVKTILLHVQDDKTFRARLETALVLARTCSAHLSCLHVTPIEAYYAFDSFGGVFVMNDVAKSIDEHEEELRSRIEADLRQEDVSWDYTQVTGDVVARIARHSALADLVVTGREAHSSNFRGPALGVLGDLLYRSRTPLFIPPDEASTPDFTRTAVIAWDGSFEAANAVRAALGLLRIASEVRVVQVRETGKEQAFPSTALLEYLSRQGIHAELTTESSGTTDGDAVAAVLLAYARAAGAGYLVMGGYNHSRVSEYVFGGVTRALLSSSPVALLVAR